MGEGLDHKSERMGRFEAIVSMIQYLQQKGQVVDYEKIVW